ncbi:hypothetical protein KJ866_04350 [Patescibacteria group bacterium]|nr:hypothetical protein [Patescibacteria group bacterium]MBU2219640.1 hypothetical protein [Patescibacteria group bacterium]MBU2264729.1 hypothetical protein [Patescibacteria group bacterium]
MIFEHSSSSKKILLAIILAVLFFGTLAILWPKIFNRPADKIVVPDEETADWRTFNGDNGASFKYPENLPILSTGASTNYIRTQEWPPNLLIADNGGFSCQEGGLGIGGRPGMTIQKTMDSIVYCIENVSEGAAGTVYTDYTYTFLAGNKLVKFNFTLAYPQCVNYDDPQKTACEQERQTFDLDMLINRMAKSLQL